MHILRQVEQFKEDGGERSNRELKGLRNQSGLSEGRAKLIEDQVFSRDWREAERERLRREEAERRNTMNNSDGGSADPDGDSGADDPDTDF
jgi:hypothetical protein